MHVLISLLNFRPGKLGGTETYLRELVPGLAAALDPHQGDKLSLLVLPENAGAMPVPEDVTVRVVPLSAASVVRRRMLEAATPWRDRVVERFIEEPKPDVTLYPQQSLYPKYPPGPCVMTVLDLQHLTHPQNLPLADRIFRGLIYSRSLHRADHLLAISKYTADTVLQHETISPEKITPIQLGFRPQVVPDEVMAPDEATAIDALPQPFLYYPASSHPHKNHLTLLRSLSILKRDNRWQSHLVLSGIQNHYWLTIQKAIEQLGLTDRVHHAGYISYAAVARLYERAAMIVFPSKHEGFGLPVVEAAMMGKPVIASDLPVFRELGVPDEVRIDFSNADELAAALQRTQPTVLEHRPITWDEHCRRTLAVLRQVATGQPVHCVVGS